MLFVSKSTKNKNRKKSKKSQNYYTGKRAVQSKSNFMAKHQIYNYDADNYQSRPHDTVTRVSHRCDQGKNYQNDLQL